MATNKRAYVATHPWLRFQVDLRQASYSLWMNLGAIQSKCEHVANVLLPPDVETLTRDLNELQQRELIVRSGKTVRANMEALQVFLPRRRPERQRE